MENPNTRFLEELDKIPDDVLNRIAMSTPWQYGDSAPIVDEDGFTTIYNTKSESTATREILQQTCWNKFNQDPFLNTAVRGQVGRHCGWGFETSSKVWDIHEAIEETELDPRNRLYNFWPQFKGRFEIEGELFLGLSPHVDGFVEVDFIDPATIKKGGHDNTGIIYHPSKTVMPLFFNVTINNETIQYPSIFIARYPELIKIAEKHQDYDRSAQQFCRDRRAKYKKFGGYSKFIVTWDKGFVTRRAVSYLRTTLQWLNHYENLKKYEIDHKKSSGAYLWTFSFGEMKDFRVWLSLTDEQRAKTGILAKKTPGSSLILPPGMTANVINPSLPTLSGQDSDIKELIASGQNEPSDVMTGTSDGNRASVLATRGPMSDRTSDEIAYFDRFLKNDFWSSIFFLKSNISNFPATFPKVVGTGFKDKKVVKKTVQRLPERFIDISYPRSETLDIEGKARALLGVKHGPMAEQLGIPNAKLAKEIGWSGYGRDRLDKAIEDEEYPELEYNVDLEQTQENNLKTSGGDKSQVKKPVTKEDK